MSTTNEDPSQLSADENALEGADVEVPNESDAAAKPNGLGKHGTILNYPNGVAAGHTGTASHFNPEEDEDTS